MGAGKEYYFKRRLSVPAHGNRGEFYDINYPLPLASANGFLIGKAYRALRNNPKSEQMNLLSAQ